MDDKVNNLKEEVDVNKLNRIKCEIFQFSDRLRKCLKSIEVDSGKTEEEKR